jgi:hypothetical protein
MILRNSEILSLMGNQALGVTGVLNTLHGRQRMVEGKDGEAVLTKDGMPMVDTVPYKFAPCTRARLAVIAAQLRPFSEAVEAARNAAVHAALDEANAGAAEPIKSITADHKLHAQLVKDIEAIIATEVEVPVVPVITMADLNADENMLAPGALVALMPVLKPA